MNLEKTLKSLTLSEKISLIEGHDSWHTYALPRLGIRSLTLTDGPHGVRKVREAKGGFSIGNNTPTSAFPTSATVASSWNPQNAYAIGQAIAEECIGNKVDVLLAPGINIKRSPLCGRNFEYYSEDPLISGVFGTSFVKGIQSLGVGCSVKHFAANSNENYRFVGDSEVDERALREIYLRAFERVITEAKPMSVMTSYNKINGVYSSENSALLQGILREEWGFDGLIMTDWGGTHNRVAGIRAGCDLDMPGGSVFNRAQIAEAIKSGALTMKQVDAAVRNVLTLINRCSARLVSTPEEIGGTNHKIKTGANTRTDPNLRTNPDPHRFKLSSHEELALKVAEDSAVLLKNDGILPLKPTNKLVVIGELFEKLKFQGAGSSLINPPRVISPKMAFDARNISYQYARGYRQFSTSPERELEEEALATAAKADTILFFGGLSDFDESEGFDRETMRLGQNQEHLLEILSRQGKKIVLILFAGAPVELPLAHQMSAILDMYLPGMAGGEATAALLLGEVNPSGKLAESWPMSAADSSCVNDYDKGYIAQYYESIYVGYRFYEKASIVPRFNFGYGLSYTTFVYSSLQVHLDEGVLTASFDLKNTGQIDGAEIVQLYVVNNKGPVFKANKELRAFAKVPLAAGESKKVDLSFPISDLAYWNVAEHRWVLERGDYQLIIAASSMDTRLQAPLHLAEGEEFPSPYPKSVDTRYAKPPRSIPPEFVKLLGHKLSPEPKTWPVTLETRMAEFRHSILGKILYKSVIGAVSRDYQKALKMPDSLERDSQLKNTHFIVKMMPFNSPRAMAMSSGGAFGMPLAQAFVDIANGHLIKGFKTMMTRIPDPTSNLRNGGKR